MKIVMTGGGTGGHIYPALAIAEKFREKDPGNEILYIGDENCMERTIVPNAGFDFVGIPAEEIDRKNALKLFKTGVKNLRGIVKSKKLIKEFGADVAIGTGGFVSFPVLYAAHRLGVKCYAHEENAFPGLANKVLEKYLEKVFLGFREGEKYFKYPEKHVIAGNPVRSSFADIDKNECRGRLDIPEDKFVILSFGGSQGAQAIDDVMYDVMKEVNGEKKIVLLLATGEIYYNDFIEKISTDGLEIKDNIIIKKYIEDMETYLGASDLVIARSGASTVTEITAAGRASVLVPSPNVAGNHQYYNAKSVADRGGAILIEESKLDVRSIMDVVVRFLNDPNALKEMSEKAFDEAPFRSTELIYETILRDME